MHGDGGGGGVVVLVVVLGGAVHGDGGGGGVVVLVVVLGGVVHGDGGVGLRLGRWRPGHSDRTPNHKVLPDLWTFVFGRVPKFP